MMNIFSVRLKALRETQQLSQCDLSKKAGVPPSVIALSENAKQIPSQEHVNRLAVVLEVDPCTLMAGVEGKFQFSHDEPSRMRKPSKEKTRGNVKPELKPTCLQVAISLSECDAIDQWRKEQPGLPSRSEAVRRMVREATRQNSP